MRSACGLGAKLSCLLKTPRFGNDSYCRLLYQKVFSSNWKPFYIVIICKEVAGIHPLMIAASQLRSIWQIERVVSRLSLALPLGANGPKFP